jgi:hypothetical protein
MIMPRSLQGTVAALALCLLLLIPAKVESGSMTLLGVGGPAASTYIGPGDLTSGALWWGGLRGYTAAYSTGSNPAIDLVDQAGANTITINIKSNGTLDVTSINAWVTAHSVSTIKVTKIYDQSGGSAGNAIQATLANMPILILNPTGLPAGKAAMQFSTANSTIISATTGISANNQPFTISTVANRTTTQTTTRGGVVALAAGGIRFGYELNANTFYQFANTSLNDIGVSSNNAWFALQAVFNGASSLVNVNGSNTGTNNPGALAGTGHIDWGTTSGGDFMDGYILEVGIWNGAISASMSANQHTAWGF